MTPFHQPVSLKTAAVSAVKWQGTQQGVSTPGTSVGLKCELD
jgi:hypothetical protein